jgi:hypothetical protein
MQAREAIRTALTSTQGILSWYLSDLADADLLVRPVPNANHIAWQLGHLIVSEGNLARMGLPSAACPELPAGFADNYTPATATENTASKFATKVVYLDLFKRTREATLAALAGVTDADLDRPMTGKMSEYAPNLGALFQLVANHTMMHAGQFTVVRRKLGKPVLF